MNKLIQKILSSAAILSTATIITIHSQIANSIYAYEIADAQLSQKFVARDSETGDRFGYAVAIAGKYALVGSAYDDDKGLVDSGAAYVFDITTGRQIQKFIANDDAAGDLFGSAVAIGGKYALVGSAYDDDKGLVDSGSAYLFDIYTGKQLQKFVATDGEAGDRFGSTVAIAGKYALVGAAYDDDKGFADSGAAYVFDIATGKQVQKFVATDGEPGDQFGYAVAIAGKYALVGAAYDDDKGLVDSGAAYVFDIITGRQIQKFIANDDAAGDLFGSAVAIAGKYALVGAAYDDDKGLGDSGSAYLFDIVTGKQIQKFVATDGEAGDRFGYAVAIAGKYALVGAAYDDDKGLVDSGAAYMFDIYTGRQIQKFIANDDAAGDLFGFAVAIAGEYVLVGATYDDDKGLGDSGSAYLFDITTDR